ncbi:MAG: RNA polymerase sigma factor [Sphingobium sp.]
MPESKAALRVYEEQHGQLILFAARLLGDPALAEDIVHDAWIRTCERALRDEVDDFGAYLRLVVRNLAIDTIRKRHRHDGTWRHGLDGSAEQAPDPAPLADATLIGREELARFQRALDLLPERQRIAVEMHRLGNY